MYIYLYYKIISVKTYILSVKIYVIPCIDGYFTSIIEHNSAEKDIVLESMALVECCFTEREIESLQSCGVSWWMISCYMWVEGLLW